MSGYLLAIDQGTTSSRAIVFDTNAKAQGVGQYEFQQFFPKPGWVEHDPEEIWQTTLKSCHDAMAAANINAQDVVALGISNQRETTIFWDRETGKALANAIVWQDRRTEQFCRDHVLQYESFIQSKTGLILDSYFSATKIMWLFEHVEGARSLAEKGRLAFGTVDSFLIWRLTAGKVHATDATNASRTLLYNIHKQRWDQDLLELFGIPSSILPEVRDCNANFGTTASDVLGAAIPITGVAGDQQAALVGQACLQPGMIKSTYGTGCFMILNTGASALTSTSNLLTTLAYRINGKVCYALEGSIFNAGTSIKWLRDRLHILQTAAQSEAMASATEDNGGVFFVPTFTGVGAPYWDASARGAILGLTRDTSVEQIVRAALEAVCYRTLDLVYAINQDYDARIQTLRVDGGMSANNWMLQFLADMLQLKVQRSDCLESSAKGAALLAGLGAGLYASLDDLQSLWQVECQFKPKMPLSQQRQLYKAWQIAIERVVNLD